MTDDYSKELSLFDKLKLYPDIVLDETLNKVKSDLEVLLDKIENPQQGENKGLILEELAKKLLTSPYLKFNRERRRCEAAEIDLDFTVKKIEATLFAEFSYLLIVECKNWDSKAPAKEIRIFCSKMREVGSTTAIFFSNKGITKDAKAIIRNAWIQDKIVVLVFDSKDLAKIIKDSDHNNLYDVLHKKFLAVVTSSRE